jgi:hypothetical protein
MDINDLPERQPLPPGSRRALGAAQGCSMFLYWAAFLLLAFVAVVIVAVLVL